MPDLLRLLRTAFVRRPLEWRPGHDDEMAPAGSFGVVAADFLDLAEQIET